MSNLTSIEVFTMSLPEKGPVIIPYVLDFRAGETSIEVDFSGIVETNLNKIDYISGVYIDLLDIADGLHCYNNATQQRVTFPELAQSWLPLFSPNPPKWTFSTVSGGAIMAAVQAQFYNMPMMPFINHAK